MKQILTVLAVIALFAFSSKRNTVADNSLATVNQLQGLYVFTDCKPVGEYKYLGTVKNGMRIAGSAQYEPVRDRLLKKIKQDYPEANGVIFSFVNGAADRADAIQFK